MSSPVIVVTGAAGFTGMHFVRAATARGYACIAIGNQPGMKVEGAERSLVLDLRDRAATIAAMRSVDPDYVVHLAAVSFVGHEDLSDFYLTNVVGTINLVDALAPSRKLRKLVIASSANIYGNARDLPIDESSKPDPQNDYAVSKVAMEHAVSLRMGSERIVIVRPFNYTGVGQAEHFLVPKIVAAHARGDSTLELGNIEVARDFSDVRDVVAAYLGLLASPFHSGVVNICCGHATSLRSILERMSLLSGHQLNVASSPALTRRQEIPTLYGSDALLRSIIGQYRRYSLEDTLRWMLQERRPPQ
jgi:nucleoside-diphosphate-sugar epimerase